MEHYPTADVNSQAAGRYFVLGHVARDVLTRLQAFSSTLYAIISIISSST